MQILDHISSLTHCDLCGEPLARTSRIVARGEQRLLGVRVPLTITVCHHCRFVFQREQFSIELLAALYENDESFAFGENDSNRQIIREHLAERQQVISDAMASHGYQHGARVLDVGGGIGECSAHLCDAHLVTVADAGSLPPVDPRIRKVDGLFSGQLEPASFEVAVLNHVLEHVFSPTAMLESAHRVLKPGGIVVIEVPFELYTPLLARHLGDWRHVVYFSRATLRQFLRKTGFEVERIELADGCYDVRRLPVIRALARKSSDIGDVYQVQKQSPLTLIRDMLAPVAIGSLANRLLRRKA